MYYYCLPTGDEPHAKVFQHQPLYFHYKCFTLSIIFACTSKELRGKSKLFSAEIDIMPEMLLMKLNLK